MSKQSLLRITSLFDEEKRESTEAFRQCYPEAFLLLQNLFVEMDYCSVLLMTEAVCMEKWNLDPETANHYLELIRQAGYLHVYHAHEKVIVITTPDLSFHHPSHTTQCDAVILLSDEDDLNDFRGLEFIQS